MNVAAHRHQSPFRRFAFDSDGHLRGWRLLAMAAGVALVLTIGGLAAVVIAGTGSPGAIALWATVAFFAIKIPVLALLWWLLGRSEHDNDDSSLSPASTSAALVRLRAAAQQASGAPDAWDRLDGLAQEAAYFAAHAPDNLGADAAHLHDELCAARDRSGRVSRR